MVWVQRLLFVFVNIGGIVYHYCLTRVHPQFLVGFMLLDLWFSVLCFVVCFCPFFYPHDITEILLKVVLNTKKAACPFVLFLWSVHCFVSFIYRFWLPLWYLKTFFFHTCFVSSDKIIFHQKFTKSLDKMLS
jgi:hypothetical protein